MLSYIHFPYAHPYLNSELTNSVAFPFIRGVRELQHYPGLAASPLAAVPNKGPCLCGMAECFTPFAFDYTGMAFSWLQFLHRIIPGKWD